MSYETEIQLDGEIKIAHMNLVYSLVKSGDEMLQTMTSDKCNLLHAVLGIAGEAGELVDAIKKHIIYEKELDHENIVEELGDLEFYLEQLRRQLGICRINTLRANIEKLQKRYPNGYTNSAACLRADKAPTPLEGPV